MSIVHRIRALFSLPKVTDDIQDELISHIEMRTDANIATGMTPEEARRDALLRFGNPAVIKEQVVAEAGGYGNSGYRCPCQICFSPAVPQSRICHKGYPHIGTGYGSDNWLERIKSGLDWVSLSREQTKQIQDRQRSE